jgi:hypothetical protein
MAAAEDHQQPSHSPEDSTSNLQHRHRHRQRRRVRVITDEAKYRQHRRKKVLKQILRWVAWMLVIGGGLLLFYLTLNKMLDRMRDTAGG